MNSKRTTSTAADGSLHHGSARVRHGWDLAAALRSASRGWLPLLATVALVAGCSPGGDLGVSGQSTDPGTLSYPVAYVKKSIPATTDDLRVLRAVLDTTNKALPTADVFVRDRADPAAPERNITTRITGTGNYDIKGLDVSFDGTKLVFAMRGPLAKNMKDTDPPFWSLYEYTFATDTLQRVIASDIVNGEGNDQSPHFLPDGRILFSSTRQQDAKAILLNEGKPQFEAQTEANTDTRNEATFNLHVMNADGTDIHEITFSQAHDRDPTVLVSGRILWSRWESPASGDGLHLFTTNPDGTDVQLLYGAHSHFVGPQNNQPIEFVQPHEMPSGQILALVRPFNGTDFGGDLYLIDTRDYVEQYVNPTTNVLSVQTASPASGLTGPAMAPATGNVVSVIPGLSSGGRFSSAYPLWDGTNRAIVSWTQCRALLNAQIVPCTSDVLANPAATPAPPLYSVWMYDLGAQAFLPLMTPTEGVMITEAVVAIPRTVLGTTLPSVILDQSAPSFSQKLANQGVGVVDIRSVYDVDGVATVNIAAVADPKQTTAAQRKARFVRIEKAVSIPPRTGAGALKLDPTAFGATNFMHEILGYAPVEPDGSVVVQVPANVSFTITFLDANARRISPNHDNWLQVRPGERLSCNGCHNPAAGTSHGRPGAFAAAYAGAAGGQPFPNTLATYTPEAGETMAEARARTTCTATAPVCSTTPSLDVKFDDVWTDPVAAGRPADASFSYKYISTVVTSPGLLTAIPTTVDCEANWSSSCRTVINYHEHIHPLWSLSRPVLDANGVVIGDNACISCHSPKDANKNPRVAAGFLDLSDGASSAVPTQDNAYRELLFGTIELNNTGQPVLVPGIDPVTGLPTMVQVPVPAPMVAGSAAASGLFLDRFAPAGGDPIHAGLLSAAELRLISEWLDIGAQYFNNPFDPTAPLN